MNLDVFTCLLLIVAYLLLLELLDRYHSTINDTIIGRT